MTLLDSPSILLVATIGLAVALAWPVPLLLARANWVSRSPRAALLLWQGVALGGALALFGALLGVGLAGGVHVAELLSAWSQGPLPAQWALVNALAFSVAILFGVLLLANLAHVAWVTERRRRQHRSRVDLLSTPMSDVSNVRLLNHPAPLAFCLPGLRQLTVLSSGLVELFDEREFEAVLAHERAHLRGQHHLMLLAFHAWHDTLPWFPVASKAETAVASLIELVADDEASRVVERSALASALRRGGGAWDDGVGFGFDDAVVTHQRSYGPRLARLESPRHRIGLAARLLVVMTSVALVIMPVCYLVQLAGRSL